MVYKRLTGLIIILIIYLVLNNLLLTSSPPVWPDEAQFADIAYNLNIKGKAISNLQGNVLFNQENTYWYPPLLFHIFSTGYKILGFSINTQRYLAGFFGLLFLVFFYLIMRKLVDEKISLIFTGLILLDSWLMQAARISRPEIFILGMISIAFWLSISYENLTSFLLIGILIGAAITIQPAGLIGLVIMILFLLNKYKKAAIIKIILVLIPVFGWLLWWIYKMNFQFMKIISVMKYHSLRKLSDPSYFSQIINMNDIWFKGLIISMMLISILALIYLIINKNIAHRFVLLLSLIIVWSFIIISKQFWYTVYIVPIIYIYFFIIIKNELKKTEKSIILNITGFIFIIFVSINLFVTAITLFKYSGNKYSYSQFGQSILKKIPNYSRVFISSLPDPYFELKKNSTLTLRQFIGLPNLKNQYLDVLNSSDYIVYTQSLDYVYGDFLVQYINKNTTSIELIDNGKEQYKAYLIKLKQPR